MRQLLSLAATFGSVLFWLPWDVLAREIPVDLTKYDPACGVVVTNQDEQINIEWPIEGGEIGRLVIDLRAGHPLFQNIAIAPRQGEPLDRCCSTASIPRRSWWSANEKRRRDGRRR